MIILSEFFSRANELILEALNNSRLYRDNFPERSSKEERDKFHAKRPGVDHHTKTALDSYIKTSNTVNPDPDYIDRDESPSDKKRRLHFHEQLKRAVGHDSDDNQISATGNVHLYRGQAHPATVDQSGHITFRRATSWSTSPPVARENAAKSRNRTPGSTSNAIHIYHLHHKNETGHRVVSCVNHSSVGRANEEEAIAGPGKYKHINTKIVGNDAKTGFPIHVHHIEYTGKIED